MIIILAQISCDTFGCGRWVLNRLLKIEIFGLVLLASSFVIYTAVEATEQDSFSREMIHQLIEQERQQQEEKQYQERQTQLQEERQRRREQERERANQRHIGFQMLIPTVVVTSIRIKVKGRECMGQS